MPKRNRKNEIIPTNDTVFVGRMTYFGGTVYGNQLQKLFKK